MAPPRHMTFQTMGRSFRAREFVNPCDPGLKPRANMGRSVGAKESALPTRTFHQAVAVQLFPTAGIPMVGTVNKPVAPEPPTRVRHGAADCPRRASVFSDEAFPISSEGASDISSERASHISLGFQP